MRNTIEIQTGSEIRVKDAPPVIRKEYIWGTEDWIYQDEHLLIKVIDAKQALSVQVHPDNAYAAVHEGGSLGKNEMWILLETQPGAYVYCGVKEEMTKEALGAAAKDGSLENYLVKYPVAPGDVIDIPAGTIHAIGGGCRILEVQQNSDLTYRLYDYKRLGADGKPRPLHLEKALDVATLTPASNLTCCPYRNEFFSVEKTEEGYCVYSQRKPAKPKL